MQNLSKSVAFVRSLKRQLQDPELLGIAFLSPEKNRVFDLAYLRELRLQEEDTDWETFLPELLEFVKKNGKDKINNLDYPTFESFLRAVKAYIRMTRFRDLNPFEYDIVSKFHAKPFSEND